jgi:hypothetical protein
MHGTAPEAPPVTNAYPEAAPSAPAAPAPAGSVKTTPGVCTLVKNVGVKVKQGEKPPPGTVRCKRFGCGIYFNPADREVPCSYHTKAPVFHETAKFWSCCQNRKAYDWDEFMSIPGCASGFCHEDPPEMREQKKFLGGCDMRNEHAPIRLDGPEEVLDARKKLDRLKAGLVACGVDEALFEKAWGRAAAKYGGLDGVVEAIRDEFSVCLERFAA